MTTDPTAPEWIEVFKKEEIKEFERHSRLGFVDHAGFLKEVARLCKVGFKRITLKTGAYGLPELAMALRWGAEAKRKIRVPDLAMVGKDVEKLPLGAIGIYTASQKIRTGLQQLMAGSRNFNLTTIRRQDLTSLAGECEKVTGIPYVMRAYRKEAEKILAQ